MVSSICVQRNHPIKLYNVPNMQGHIRECSCVSGITHVEMLGGKEQWYWHEPSLQQSSFVHWLKPCP